MKTLTDIIYKYRNQSLDYSTLDCCTFTAKIVEEYFDIDLPLWKDMLGYNNYKDALRVLKKHNINSIEELPTKILGTEKKPISEVKTGDVVYALNDNNDGVLGICNGVRAYFIQPEIGIIAVPIEKCIYAWDVNNA